MGGKVFGDIRQSKENIPAHDILCAGFPCQPFSKSGEQRGTNDKTRGTLFHEIIEILRVHKPKYFILENVGNFERHDGGNTWKVVKDSLIELGYDVRGTEHVTPPSRTDWRDRAGNLRRKTASKMLESIVADTMSRNRGHGLISPHHLGFPQGRERFFIVGAVGGLPPEPFPPADRDRKTSLDVIVQIYSELTEEDRNETRLTSQQEDCIDHWNELLRGLPKTIELPSFPIWGDELDASYPYERKTPWATPPRELRHRIPGQRFPKWTRRDVLIQALPSYARERVDKFRGWKIGFIRQNREWFQKIKPFIPSGWPEKLRALPPSLRKLEWNVKGGERDIWKHVLQFRPSGLRVRRYDRSPALVAMTATQIPLLGPRKRFLTRREGRRLQGFPDKHVLPNSRATAFAALGNAVHVDVIEAITTRLLAPRSAPAAINERVPEFV